MSIDGPLSSLSDPSAPRPFGPDTGNRLWNEETVRPGPIIAAIAALTVVVLTQLFPDAYPLGRVLKGAVFGTGAGLMAVGLVLTYRTTRIVNFAYGAMGTFGAGVAVGLKLGRDVPWTIAVPVGVVSGIAVGALVERLVIRRFAHAPRLLLTVATIGLAQLLGGLGVKIPDWFAVPVVIPGFRTGLSESTWSVGESSFNGNDLALLAIVPVLLGGLSWFLYRTEAGMAVRGMSENMDRARLLGIPVNQLSLLLWSMTGGVAAVTVILQAPNKGLPLDASAGPTILLPALAAAVVSGMRSLPGAFAAGVGLGVLEQLMRWNFPDEAALTDVTFLVVIILALLLQRRTTSRALLADDSSWSTMSVQHKLPKALSALPELRFARIAGFVGIGVLFVVLPFVVSDSQTNRATIALVYALAALSLVILTGWGGVVSLGQVAIVGVGGILAANLLADRNTDMFLILGACAVAGGLVALIIGLPALRVSGQFLAVTTLAFAVAADNYFFNPSNNPSWFPTNFDRPELWGAVDLTNGNKVSLLGLDIDLSGEHLLYYLTLGVLVVGMILVANLRRARSGRIIAAARDNERAVSAVGVNTTEARLAGFVFAGMFAGMAGALHAVTLRGVGAQTYPSSTSMLLFSMVVIGGAASIGGALSGVLLVYWLGYLFPELQLLITGVGLLVILMLLPNGLGGTFEALRDRFARSVARRRGVVLMDDLATVDQPLDHVHIDTGETPQIGGGGGHGATLLSCERVESSYGSLQVLFGIDTVVGDGELLALLGTNGAGKSTLLRSISGLLPPDNGRITFDGHDITGMSAERIAQLGLSLMPGGRGVFPTLTVADNLRLASWMLRHRRKEATAAREQAIQLFPILKERWDQMAGDLSGGEQQQLSLAMAFVTRPKLLCIDELSLGLAPTVVGQLVDKVKEIHRSGTSIVVVEQSVNVALLLAERAVFLEKGQVRFRGPTAGLMDRPDVLRAVFLGGGDNLTHQHDDRPADRPSRGVALECRGLTKRFGGITAVNQVDLVVPPATIVGLVGHNGAGKTTLFDVLTGYLPADGGRVLLGGRDVTQRPPHRRAIAQLGRSFQEAKLYPSLTVAESLEVALECHLPNRDPLAAALRLPASTSSERAAARRADELIEILGMGAYRDRPTGELSTGTRRIVELGCLLAHNPAVVLLDEPSAGVAQRETEALGPMLRRVQAATGCSLVIIEHDMSLLSSICDALVALEQGSVIAWGAPDDVLADHRVVSSYLGTDNEVVHRTGPRRGWAASP
ncbi:MAG TPA: ATP-binding cassette domain-containing protein [Acidimicrobiales bacterium]|nr:ATP-binding cassette domain-containing protein [Acidimicrobiales bacterium]